MASSYVVKDCRGNRESVVEADNFNDLLCKGCSKLGINLNEDFPKLIYEDYCAEIINQEYFSFLPRNSSFRILKNGEQWPQEINDISEETHQKVKEAAKAVRNICTLTDLLRKNHDCLDYFSAPELKKVLGCEPKYLASLLTTSEEVATTIRDKCRDKFDEIFDELQREEWDEVFEEARSKLENGTLRVKTTAGGTKIEQKKSEVS